MQYPQCVVNIVNVRVNSQCSSCHQKKICLIFQTVSTASTTLLQTAIEIFARYLRDLLAVTMTSGIV